MLRSNTGSEKRYKGRFYRAKHLVIIVIPLLICQGKHRWCLLISLQKVGFTWSQGRYIKTSSKLKLPFTMLCTFCQSCWPLYGCTNSFGCCSAVVSVSRGFLELACMKPNFGQAGQFNWENWVDFGAGPFSCNYRKSTGNSQMCDWKSILRYASSLWFRAGGLGLVGQ